MPEININGVKTNYVVVGQGSPLLILHGWGSNTERWAEVVDMISKKGFKVIIPDLPGFGKSDSLQEAWTSNKYVAWAEEFVKKMNFGDFYLLGHSFGGALACKIAIKYPQNVKKLFLVSSAAVRRKTNKKATYRIVSKLAKLFSFLPGYKLFRKAMYKFVIRNSDYPFVEGNLKQTFLNVINEDLSEFTGFINVPTIIIWGDKDTSTPVQDAYFLNKKIKNSKLIIIPGADHMLNRKNPEVLAQKVLENI